MLQARKAIQMNCSPRDPSIEILPTLGPKVCKYDLHWAIWIPSLSFLIATQTSTLDPSIGVVFGTHKNVDALSPWTLGLPGSHMNPKP